MLISLVRVFSGFRLFGHVQPDCAHDSPEAVNHGHAEDSVGSVVMGDETYPHRSQIVRSPCRGILNAGNEDASLSWKTGVKKTQPETLNQFDSGTSFHNNWLPNDNKSLKHETLMGQLNQKGNESESESRCDSPASVSEHVQIADMAASGQRQLSKPLILGVVHHPMSVGQVMTRWLGLVRT